MSRNRGFFGLFDDAFDGAANLADEGMKGTADLADEVMQAPFRAFETADKPEPTLTERVERLERERDSK